jgi:hypothetical protein
MPAKSENGAALSWDVTRIPLAVVSIGGLIAATFWGCSVRSCPR